MKVLILDDSRTDAYLATQVASQFFDTVEAYGTPAELHAALKREPLPDLLLFDVHVGDLHNGINELDTIKAPYDAASVVPVFVVTASTDEALHDFAIRSGADAVIVKPITSEKLEALLRTFVPKAVKSLAESSAQQLAHEPVE